MKREYLLTIVVLSAGFWLASPWLRPPSPVAAQQDSAPGDQGIASPDVAGAVQGDSPRIDVSQIESTRKLVRDAATGLAQSPPLKARLRFQINLFEQSFSGPGRYFQAGQGSRKTRLEFEFGLDDSSVQLHQFCNGHVLYNLTIAGDKQRLEFVDLGQLDPLGRQGSDQGTRVASWLAMGSLSGLLNQLAEHFEFQPATAGALGAIPVIHCTGQWRAAALGRLMHDQIDPAVTADGNIRWQQLPQHLPHQVRLTLGNDDRFPGFPYRIVFEQFRPEDGRMVPRPFAILELYEVQQIASLPDEMFEVPTIRSVPHDATGFYRKRIDQFTR